MDMIEREKSKATSKISIKIGILNLMPTKERTENQFKAIFSQILTHANQPVEIELVWIKLETHVSKNTSEAYLNANYVPYSQVESEALDGMIVTGAPVETLPFENVDYWDELMTIFNWVRQKALPTFFICWGAQAALYHYYDIPKYALSAKCFGVFEHRTKESDIALMKQLGASLWIPQSRHTEIRHQDVSQVAALSVVAEAPESGIGLIISNDGREIYATGHSEYDVMTLSDEYNRDVQKGLPVAIPNNYFEENNSNLNPINKWLSAGQQLFENWVSYYVIK